MITQEEKQLCIEKWQWFFDHPEYDDLSYNLVVKLGSYNNYCPLCDYYLNTLQGEFLCPNCPVVIQSGKPCESKGYFAKWTRAKTNKTRKKYAGKLLEIMKSIEIKNGIN